MPQHSSLGRWQAHYDLKDPAGLAGFLIHSDIKLIRAECGSPDPEVSMFMECDGPCHGILLWCTTKNVRDNSLNFCHPLPPVVAGAKSKSSWGLEFCVYMPEPLKMDFVYCFEMFFGHLHYPQIFEVPEDIAGYQWSLSSKAGGREHDLHRSQWSFT